MSIKSKIHNYGHEHESEWPPKYGTEDKGGVWHYDKKLKKMVQGYPEPDIEKFGEAPQVIFDSMPPTYHQAACRTIESRKEWKLADKEHNTITFGSYAETALKSNQDYERKKYKEDQKNALIQAYKAYEANPKEVKQKVEKKAEQQLETLKKSGVDVNKLVESGVKVDGNRKSGS